MDKTTGLDYGKKETNPAEIQSSLEETRAQLGETVEEIKERFSPGHMKSQVREGTIGRAKEIVQTTAQRARELGSSAVETVRQDPLPYLSIGAGLGIGIGGLLWLLRRRGENGYSREESRELLYPEETHDYSGGMEEEPRTMKELARKTQEKARRAREQAGFAFERAKEKTGELKERAIERSRELKSHMDDSLRRNPFVLGSLFFVLGSAIGFLFPSMAGPLVEKVGTMEIGSQAGEEEGKGLEAQDTGIRPGEPGTSGERQGFQEI